MNSARCTWEPAAAAGTRIVPGARGEFDTNAVRRCFFDTAEPGRNRTIMLQYTMIVPPGMQNAFSSWLSMTLTSRFQPGASGRKTAVRG